MATKRKQIEKFIELRAEGLSYDEISKKINISKPVLVRLSKDYEEKIADLIVIKEEQFVNELRSRNMREVRRLLSIRERAYDELTQRECDKMGVKELIFLIRNVEEHISKKTNIEHILINEWKVRQEQDSVLKEYEKQNEILSQLYKNSSQSDRDEIYSAQDLTKLKEKYPVKLEDANKEKQSQSKKKGSKNEKKKK